MQLMLQAVSSEAFYPPRPPRRRCLGVWLCRPVFKLLVYPFDEVIH